MAIPSLSTSSLRDAGETSAADRRGAHNRARHPGALACAIPTGITPPACNDFIFLCQVPRGSQPGLRLTRSPARPARVTASMSAGRRPLEPNNSGLSLLLGQAPPLRAQELGPWSPGWAAQGARLVSGFRNQHSDVKFSAGSAGHSPCSYPELCSRHPPTPVLDLIYEQ